MMDITAFAASAPGRLVPTIREQKAFVPNPLPPDLDIAPIQQTLSDADQKIGELRGIGRYIPNPYLLIRPLQRREAIASSNIEGTYTSLPELLMLESGVEDQPRTADTQEVLNYTRALRQGIERLDQLPISTRLICELHKELLANLPRRRAGYLQAGDYRQDQNFIGRIRDIAKSRFNPPPPPIHRECMSDLEKFINSSNNYNIPALVLVSLIHYQFETIHPFPDGNGRVGRILIPLILKSKSIMEQPLLYMSQFFEDNRDEYVDLLLAVSQRGAWVEWIEFFLKGVTRSCDKTIETIHKVRELQDSYKERCQQARNSVLLLQIVDSLFESIVTTVPIVRQMTGTSYTAALNNVKKLVKYDILKPAYVSTHRPKYYFATELINLFES